MAYFWWWVLIVLFIVAIFSWPTWPYARGRWNYGPSGAAAAVFILVLALIWLGFFAVWWPWIPRQEAHVSPPAATHSEVTR